MSAAGGLGALALMATLTSQSVLAAELTSAHEDTIVHVDGLQAKNIGLVGTAVGRAAGPDDPSARERGRLGMHLDDVSVNGLCLLATHEVPLLGRLSTVVTAGEPVDGTITDEDEVRLETLDLDLSEVDTDADSARKLTLGRAAETIDQPTGSAGAFGLSVERIEFTDLALTAGALDMSAGATLPNLGIRTVTGPVDRSDCS